MEWYVHICIQQNLVHQVKASPLARFIEEESHSQAAHTSSVEYPPPNKQTNKLDVWIKWKRITDHQVYNILHRLMYSLLLLTSSSSSSDPGSTPILLASSSPWLHDEHVDKLLASILSIAQKSWYKIAGLLDLNTKYPHRQGYQERTFSETWW